MSPDVLATELNREPFVPLRLHLSDGRAIEIHNPGLCFIARLALYVFKGHADDALAEDVQVINLGQIVCVETFSSAPRAQ